MSKVKTVWLACLIAAMVCVQASAESWLPDSAIGDKTYLVLHVTTSKLDDATLKATAVALLGDQSAAADATLLKFKDMHDAVEKAGGGSLAAVANVPGEGDQEWPQFIFYIQTKPGSDTDAIKKLLTKDMRPEDQARWQFDTAGNFMVMHQIGIEVPKQGSPAMGKLFAEAFKANGDKAVTLTIVSSDALRAQMKKPDNTPPQNLSTLTPQLTGSKFIAASINAGDAPSLELSVQTADDASAKAIVDEATQLIQDLHAFADNLRQQGVVQMQSLVTLADQLKPVQKGSQVNLTLDSKALAPIVTTYLHNSMTRRAAGRRMGPQSAPAPGQ